MESASERADELKRQIAEAERQLEVLRSQLNDLESAATPGSRDVRIDANTVLWNWPLDEGEYARYGRQLILPNVGIGGQLRLRKTAVLIVGAGGLGCPAAAYLAGAGVGKLGIADGDTVEESNLHRQIAHSTARVGMKKVDSLASYCQQLNPNVFYIRHGTHLNPQNAQEVVREYDVVLDCTDHPTSRYLISDVCVLLQKPLVSASALRTDGQLMVLNNPPAPQGSPEGGPCYRCVFPKPPPPDSVISCGEGGILGPVVGVMGVLQALEAIKLIATGLDIPLEETRPPSLLLLSASGPTTFRAMKMRGRRSTCVACSAASTLSPVTIKSELFDYEQFCGVQVPVCLLGPNERIKAAAYKTILDERPSREHVLLDVREREHFDIAHIPGAVSVPFSAFQMHGKSTADPKPKWLPEALPPDAPIYVVCRVGNDSQIVTRKLKEMGLDQGGKRFIGDIQGGMKAWKQEVDKTLPFT